MNFLPQGNSQHDRRRLPRMTPEERQLWANSHALPEGMVILYNDEVAALSVGARALGNELEKWRLLGRTHLATESPEVAIQLLGKWDEASKTAGDLLRRAELHLMNTLGPQEFQDRITVFLGVQDLTHAEERRVADARDRLAAIEKGRTQ